MMADPASYLANQLLQRLRELELILGEDAAGDAHDGSKRRQELVAKILAIQAGVTDWSLVQLVVSALPTISPKREISDRERTELADFLRRQLPLDN